MRILKLVGLSEDGKELVLTDAETGDDFAVPMDERLRAAVVHDRVRLGQLELAFSSSLRPKEIQARVRAGESTEQVAAAAGIPVERALRFAAPVLAEREHVATQARRSVLRRPGAESPKALAEAVAERLHQRGVPPSELAWDAWRRDDGKWTVSAAYRSGERARRALFVYDPLSRVVLPADDESRWLAGEPGPLHGPQPRTPAPRTRPAEPASQVEEPRATVESRPPLRLASTAETEFGAEPDASADNDGLFEPEAGPDEQPTVEMPPVAALPSPAAGSEPDDLAADEFADFDDEPTVDDAAEPVEEKPAEDKPAAKKTARRRRAAVPSWDDILFGAKNNAD